MRVRQFTLDPGETVPCAAFPGDDVVVTSLNANLAGVRAVSLRVTGPGDAPVGAIDDIPVAAAATGLLWATPGAFVRSMPSQQLRLTLRSADDAGVLGEYILEHTGEYEPGGEKARRPSFAHEFARFRGHELSRRRHRPDLGSVDREAPHGWFPDRWRSAPLWPSQGFWSSPPPRPRRRGPPNPITAPVTFSKDVAPIFQAKCQECHQPNSIAPMSLITYQDARPWARAIKERVVARQMPPWHIDQSVGVQHFKNDMSLSDAQIDTIVKWVDAGAPQGDPEGHAAAEAARHRQRVAGREGRLRSAGPRDPLLRVHDAGHGTRTCGIGR